MVATVPDKEVWENLPSCLAECGCRGKEPQENHPGPRGPQMPLTHEWGA